MGGGGASLRDTRKDERACFQTCHVRAAAALMRRLRLCVFSLFATGDGAELFTSLYSPYAVAVTLAPAQRYSSHLPQIHVCTHVNNKVFLFRLSIIELFKIFRWRVGGASS